MESKGPPICFFVDLLTCGPKGLPVKMVRSSQEQHNEHRENLEAKNAQNCVFDASQVWGFPKIGDFPPKWMVKIMEKPIKMGWFGGTTI